MNEKNEKNEKSEKKEEKLKKTFKYSFCHECENYKTSYTATKFENCPLNKKMRECKNHKVKQENDKEENAFEYYKNVFGVGQSQMYKIMRGEFNPYKKLEDDDKKVEEIAKNLKCAINEIECPYQKKPEFQLIGYNIPNPGKYYEMLWQDSKFRKDVMELHDAIYDIMKTLGDNPKDKYKNLEEIIKGLPNDILNKLKLNEINGNCTYNEFKNKYLIEILAKYLI